MSVDGSSDATLTRPVARPVRATRRQAYLHVVYPRALATTIDLSARETVLGRKPSGERAGDSGPDAVVLADATVSREHALIRRDASVAALRDLGSRNGTFVDGRRLSADEEGRLEPGAVVRFGDVVAVWEVGLGQPEAGESVRIPGVSTAARALRRQIRRAAADPSPALLVGETGTGKEWVARELHRLSGRPGRRQAINCAELSRELIESQLFGHERGAFTGANERREGLFRLADGGTLMLDEIGELPMELQPKLLRALQEREVRPVGGARAVPVDVRIIAATNRDLQKAVSEGTFRRDLYARLALWEVEVPALRTRRADILEWLDILESGWRRERGHAETGLTWTAEAAEAVLLAGWPDNLRGLERLVHRLATRESPTAPVVVDDLGFAPPATASPPPPRRPPPTDRAALEAVLAETGSVRAAARWYGRDRRQLYRWMEAFGLKA